MGNNEINKLLQDILSSIENIISKLILLCIF